MHLCPCVIIRGRSSAEPARECQPPTLGHQEPRDRLCIRPTRSPLTWRTAHTESGRKRGYKLPINNIQSDKRMNHVHTYHQTIMWAAWTPHHIPDLAKDVHDFVLLPHALVISPKQYRTSSTNSPVPFADSARWKPSRPQCCQRVSYSSSAMTPDRSNHSQHVVSCLLTST